MTDRPIIFSAPMVRALLDGRKTQTRRMAWRGPNYDNMRDLMRIEPGNRIPTIWQKVEPGDRLWVREMWAAPYIEEAGGGSTEVFYRADGDRGNVERWCASLFMPRWASRLTLIVTDARVERLQDISDADAIAEGIEQSKYGWLPGNCDYADWAFRILWNQLHGPGDWADNPEVVVISFAVHKVNIDDGCICRHYARP